MRILMLLARTGRRVNEICLLDRDPLLPLGPAAQRDRRRDGFVARLRYQQTKIDGAPDTILVDAGDRRDHPGAAAVGRPSSLAGRRRRHRAEVPVPRARGRTATATAPTPPDGFDQLLGELARRLDVRDGAGPAGRLPPHPPLPAHQGHQPAQRRRPAARRAALPRPPVTGDDDDLRRRPWPPPTKPSSCATASSPPTPASSTSTRATSTTCSQLDKRTDRILPNGWCLLPPRQLCDQGQRLPDLRQVRHRRHLPARADAPSTTAPGQLIDHRQPPSPPAPARTMGEDNVWLAGRRQEQHALDPSSPPWSSRHQPTATSSAVRGAGTAARTDRDRQPGQQPPCAVTPTTCGRPPPRKSAAAQPRAETALRDDDPARRPDHLPRPGPDRRRLPGLPLPPLPTCAAASSSSAPSSRPGRSAHPRTRRPDQPSSVVRTLTAQLAELKRRHRDEITALKQALEAAHGENLDLRRRLGHRATTVRRPPLRLRTRPQAFYLHKHQRS